MSTTDMLADIFERQHRLQVESFGKDPSLLSPEDRAQFIKDMTLAATDELHEALAEVGWKPWASSRHINRDSYGVELVDAVHFIVNLFLAAGFTAEDVHRIYLAKAEKNAARQRAGYDGVSGKCPTCHRSYDDVGVDCKPGYSSLSLMGPLPVDAYCSMTAKS